MVRVKCIAENSHCVASITVRARKGTNGTNGTNSTNDKESTMMIGNKAHKILGIIHYQVQDCNKTQNH